MRPIFVVGAPRSGTTWVQLLLAQHPGVVTCQETHLFERYLDGLAEAWEWDREAGGGRDVEISGLVSEEEFFTLCRQFGDGVLGRIAGSSSGARFVLEKTPGHARSLGFIRRLYPEAHLVNVVRDPRAVTASLLRAGRSWGSHWAPTGPTACAALWSEHVAPAVAHGRTDPRCHQVSYERLSEDAADALVDLAGCIGLEVDESFCRRAAEACRLDRLREESSEVEAAWHLEEEPEGFFGPGRTQGWREELTGTEVRAVECEVGPLMEELGYSRESGTEIRPLRSWLRSALGRLHAGLEWRIRHLMRKL